MAKFNPWDEKYRAPTKQFRTKFIEDPKMPLSLNSETGEMGHGLEMTLLEMDELDMGVAADLATEYISAYIVGNPTTKKAMNWVMPDRTVMAPSKSTFLSIAGVLVAQSQLPKDEQYTDVELVGFIKNFPVFWANLLSWCDELQLGAIQEAGTPELEKDLDSSGNSIRAASTGLRQKPSTRSKVDTGSSSTEQTSSSDPSTIDSEPSVATWPTMEQMQMPEERGRQRGGSEEQDDILVS